MPFPTFNNVTSPSPVLHFGSKAAFLHDLRDPRIYPTPLMLHSSSFMVAETQKGLDLRRRPSELLHLAFAKLGGASRIIIATQNKFAARCQTISA